MIYGRRKGNRGGKRHREGGEACYVVQRRELRDGYGRTGMGMGQASKWYRFAMEDFAIGMECRGFE